MKELILREAKVKETTGLSKSTRWRLEKAGQFPKKIQLSPRAVGWRSEEIIQWCRSREAAKNEPVAKKKNPDPAEARQWPEAEGLKDLDQSVDHNGDSGRIGHNAR